MGTEEYLVASNPAYTPDKRKLMQVGDDAAFQSWLEEEEEEWRISQRLTATCPAEFICPISLDIMVEPVVLVRSLLLCFQFSLSYRGWSFV
jgi:hypothetical protein